MKKEHIGLAVAVLLIAWLSAALVRVENQQYALEVGLCRDKAWPTASGPGSNDFKLSCICADAHRLVMASFLRPKGLGGAPLQLCNSCVIRRGKLHKTREGARTL